jgi:hypothetical protein
MYSTTTVQRQDELRSERNFISLLSGALGINDQSLASQDGMAVARPGRYQVIDPVTGAVGVQGSPMSTAQVRSALPTVLLIAGVVAVGLYLVKGR